MRSQLITEGAQRTFVLVFDSGEDGTPTLHPHIVVAKADGSAHGGHLLEGHVRPPSNLSLPKRRPAGNAATTRNRGWR